MPRKQILSSYNSFVFTFSGENMNRYFPRRFAFSLILAALPLLLANAAGYKLRDKEITSLTPLTKVKFSTDSPLLNYRKMTEKELLDELRKQLGQAKDAAR
jgi:hypothetical protein